MASQISTPSSPFVSYAQHGEDVVLHRALKQIREGFYVDVGAHHPVTLSVTKAFYDRGWHGINIEPEDECYQRLAQERTRDINLQVLISDTDGSAEFNEVLGTGLSTQDHELALTYSQRGYEVRKKQVRICTLETILEQHAQREVHFLKVDVEGTEEKVIKGLLLDRYRPWVIVVEATEPLTTRRSDESISSYLASKNYRHALFDGLNSFYVSAEHSELCGLLAAPANPLDEYILPVHHEVYLYRGQLESYRKLWAWGLMQLEARVRNRLSTLLKSRK
jgi:FkbM family methyltransferase